MLSLCKIEPNTRGTRVCDHDYYSNLYMYYAVMYSTEHTRASLKTMPGSFVCVRCVRACVGVHALVQINTRTRHIADNFKTHAHTHSYKNSVALVMCVRVCECHTQTQILHPVISARAVSDIDSMQTISLGAYTRMPTCVRTPLTENCSV